MTGFIQQQDQVTAALIDLLHAQTPAANPYARLLGMLQGGPLQHALQAQMEELLARERSRAAGAACGARLAGIEAAGAVVCTDAAPLRVPGFGSGEADAEIAFQRECEAREAAMPRDAE
jgi:hypothetical protein